MKNYKITPRQLHSRIPSDDEVTVAFIQLTEPLQKAYPYTYSPFIKLKMMFELKQLSNPKHSNTGDTELFVYVTLKFVAIHDLES